MAMDTGPILGIVLGGAIVLVFIAGMIKVRLNKKKLIRDTEKAHAQAAAKADQEKSKRPVGEGDFFGGVAQTQSRPASPTPSYLLAPGQQLVDWSRADKSSITSYNMETASSVSRDASPLRLQPPNHLLRQPSAISLAGGVGGDYTPPLPSPREHRTTIPATDASKSVAWVSPLDVHFSRPTTPKAAVKARPTSYLPRMEFPSGEIQKPAFLATSVATVKSETTSETPSIVSTDITVPAAVRHVGDAMPSPTASIYPQSRKARQNAQSFFSSANERPSSRKSNKSFNSGRSPYTENFPDVPIPLNSLPPQLASVDPNTFPHDNREWNTGPIIRNSVVSKHRISLFQPGSEPKEASARHSRVQSVAASSIYSARTSVIEPETSQPNSNRPLSSQPQTESSNPEPVIPIPPRSQSRPSTRSRSTSTSRRKSTSARLSRSRDSVRLQQSRQLSYDSEGSRSRSRSTRRRSRDRDVLHYDPSSTSRIRSGSIQGRNVDFDHPRESPFSNLNTIAPSEHSASSSMSSITSGSSGYSAILPPHPHIADRSMYESSEGNGHGISVSEFGSSRDRTTHDSTYGQTHGKRQSVLNQARAIENLNDHHSNGMQPRDSASNSSSGSKRPSPLTLRNGWDTIEELPTPVPGPQEDRYPRML